MAQVTVYVDDARIWATVGGIRARWSHLLADDEAELHAFAARLRLRRAWFQDPRLPRPGRPLGRPGTLLAEAWHYDVVDAKRELALTHGAVPITWRDAIEVARRRLAGRDGEAGD